MRVPLVLVVAAASLLGAATPVPHPPQQVPGSDPAAGVVRWEPAVQIVTGTPGEVVAIDLALTDATADPVTADLSVREVRVDPAAGVSLDRPSRLVALATDEVRLVAGERVALRGTAVVPDRPRLVGIEATLRDARDAAAPSALVLLGPDTPATLDIEIAIDGRTATVTLHNRSDFAAIADLHVVASSWLGTALDRTVHDLAIAGDGTRSIEVPTGPGLGPQRVSAAAAARGGATTRGRATAWSRGSTAGLAGLVLLVAATLALLASWRRRRDHPPPGDPRGL